MRDVSPETKELAQRLLWQEAGGRLDAENLAKAAERILDRLRRKLTDLLGQAGFIALYRRALRLAQGEYPALENLAVDAKPDERLLGLHEFAAANSENLATFVAGFSTLLAHLIWLLVTFIGDSLTVRLINEIWPEIAQYARDPSTRIWRDDA